MTGSDITSSLFSLMSFNLFLVVSTQSVVLQPLCAPLGSNHIQRIITRLFYTEKHSVTVKNSFVEQHINKQGAKLHREHDIDLSDYDE